ncbi:MAG: galactose-1-phosphate uridylyltransferase [Bacteroidota bacterium]
MSELRQNLITRDWVIMATERAGRPDQFVQPKRQSAPLPAYHPECPFCPGNEHLAVVDSEQIREGSTWKVRAVPNKYPALCPTGERVRKTDGLNRSIAGIGFHEVIIEHPRHDMTTAILSLPDVAAIITMYRMRYAAIRKDLRVEAIVIFKNYGEAAGTSIAHPHSQIAATPIVPTQIRTRMEEAIRFLDDTGECLFCRTLKEELSSGERVIVESEHFVAFHPYAALSPFHTWIFPRRHMSSFDEISDAEIVDLAFTLKTFLGKLYFGLGDPDFNLSIRSIPTNDRNTEYFHWYVAVIPRVTRTAGFEMGSGMFINTMLPEESAKFLRAVKIPE